MSILKKRKNVLLILVLISIFLRTRNMLMPIANDGHNFRQTETAIVVQNYFNEGCSILHYQIPVLGQPWEVPFEFPIYQMTVYFLMKIFNQTNIDLWCRIVSLISFYLSSLVLYKITKLMMDRDVSLCICMVYLFSPFTILWSRAALIDYMSVLFALLYVYGVYSWLLDRRKSRFIIAIIFGCAAYLLKATTMFPYVFFLAFFILNYFLKQMKSYGGKFTLNTVKYFLRHNIGMLILLSILCILPVIPGIVWTGYADTVKGRSIYTRSLTSSRLKYWNYGTLQQKMDWANWKVILYRILSFVGGRFVFLFLFFNYILFNTRKYNFILISSVSAILLTIGTLFNLYYIHDYYMIAISPVLSICLGIAIFVVVNKLINEGTVGWIVAEAICLTIIFEQVNYNEYYLKIALDGEMTNDNVGLYVNEITTPDERLLIEGEDWSPVTMYYANRKGLMSLDKDDPIEDGFIKEENYTTLVAHSIDYVDVFSDTQDILIQYPKQNDVFVYKFFDNMYFVGSMPYQETIYVTKEQIDYYIQNSNLDTIQIEYDGSLAGIEVEMVIEDKEGKQYYDQVYLLKNKKSVCYKISEVTDNVNKISFVIGNGDIEEKW